MLPNKLYYYTILSKTVVYLCFNKYIDFLLFTFWIVHYYFDQYVSQSCFVNKLSFLYNLSYYYYLLLMAPINSMNDLHMVFVLAVQNIYTTNITENFRWLSAISVRSIISTQITQDVVNTAFVWEGRKTSWRCYIVFLQQIILSF